jgi:hypothetical protein
LRRSSHVCRFLLFTLDRARSALLAVSALALLKMGLILLTIVPLSPPPGAVQVALG